jgi:prepilin-type processing-associated H-X9-DG protein
VQEQPKTSGLAIASLVLGISGVFCSALTALPGLVLGIVALLKIKRSEGKLTGSGLAIGGICASVVFLLFVPIMAAMLMPALARARAMARTPLCQNNLKQLGMVISLYENDERQLPDASKWCDEMQPVYIEDEEVFQCPEAEGLRCAYAMNEHLGAKSLAVVDDPARTVLLFESDLGWNGSGGRADLPEEPRHPRGHTILFADGHVEVVSPERVDDLVWSPAPWDARR